MRKTIQKPLTPSQALRHFDEMRAMIADRAEPVDPEKLTRLEEALQQLKQDREWSLAMVLALISDEPVPVKLFRPWASHSTISRWATRVEKAKRLPTTLLNGKLCVRPSDFFAAFKSHGRAAA